MPPPAPANPAPPVKTEPPPPAVAKAAPENTTKTPAATAAPLGADALLFVPSSNSNLDKTTNTTPTPANATGAPQPIAAAKDTAPAPKIAAAPEVKKQTALPKPAPQPKDDKAKIPPPPSPLQAAAAKQNQLPKLAEQDVKPVAEAIPPDAKKEEEKRENTVTLDTTQCIPTTKYTELLKKIGMIEEEKEKLRRSTAAPIADSPLQAIMQCAAETNQIRDLKTQIDILQKENQTLKKRSDSADTSIAGNDDAMSEALKELDTMVAGDKPAGDKPAGDKPDEKK